ncbi:hypothetical protein GIV96_25580 [Pseudomonas syringae]|uniref:hypothetical protein n=1 Tax=Pseudomonas syringae TaxID=317 RepID=UPI000463C9B5|nr:hypothetical protein [Pseudomonas syringae]AZG89397.1 hypothetical protein N032_28000 [Pseudomonas syringae pv. pisi str. PP1]MCF5395298.1 hypothetical protein [Pseudomonas syringae]MCF5403350.1 hypothetical protein [Pseudomonas syringae]
MKTTVRMRMKKLAIAVVMAITATGPAMAPAIGFPVVDVASVAQAVADYSNQLLQYTEQMQQTILEQSQLAQLIATYEQTMTSYYHMLSQMQGLERLISKRDYMAIMQRFSNVIDQYPGNAPDFKSREWMAKGKELSRMYSRVADARDLENALRAIPFDAESQERQEAALEQANTMDQMAVGQSLFSEAMNDELLTNVERSGEVADKRRSLGPEDHLATLQLMAEQNELTIESVQQANAIANAQLQYSNQLPAHFFARRNLAKQATLEETKARLGAEINVDNTKLTDY